MIDGFRNRNYMCNTGRRHWAAPLWREKMTFNDYADLTHNLIEAVIARIPASPEMTVKLGYSNISCSAYVNVTFWSLDEDGDQDDCFGGCKVRFSDHADRNGSDLTIRFDDVLDSDELGEVELADWRIEEMVGQAVAVIERNLKEQTND